MLREINGRSTLIRMGWKRSGRGLSLQPAVTGDQAAQTSVLIKLHCHPSAKVENGVESGSEHPVSLYYDGGGSFLPGGSTAASTRTRTGPKKARGNFRKTWKNKVKTPPRHWGPARLIRPTRPTRTHGRRGRVHVAPRAAPV